MAEQNQEFAPPSRVEGEPPQDAPVDDRAEDEDIDGDFKQQETVCIEIDSEDDLPPSDDDDMEDEEPQEMGVVTQEDIYGKDEYAGVDHALTKVEHTDSVLSVSFNRSNPRQIATSGQDDMAYLWNIEETSDGIRCVQKAKLEGHTDSVVHVQFNHNGELVATAGYDAVVRIWNSASGVLIHALDGPAKEIEWISWHPKGDAILAGSTDTMAWMWWAPTGKLMQIFAGHAQGVTCGAWPLQGKLICTGSDDASLIVWNPRAGTPQQHIRNLHESSITCVCAHSESPIVVTGSEDSTAKVVQIETGKVLATLGGHTDSIETVAFSGVCGAGIQLLGTCSMDGKVQIWDGKTFQLRHVLREHFEKGGVTKFKWVQNDAYGALLCTASADCTVRMFDGLAGQCVQVLAGHSDTVFDIDLAVIGDPGSQKLCVLSGSDDKSCRIFVVPLQGPGAPQPGQLQPGGTAAPQVVEGMAAAASATAVTPAPI